MSVPQIINRTWLRRKIIFRSYFIQSMWNYRSFLGAGFLYCLMPLMKILYHSKEDQRDFLRRHSGFFNAHPYLATYALGVAMRVEEEIAGGDREAAERLSRLKTLMISLLGARGDHLFWFSLKPSTLLMGTALLIYSDAPWMIALSLTCIFLIYNIPHVHIRNCGLREGYEQGMEVYRCFSRERFEKMRILYLLVGTLAYLLIVVTIGVQFWHLGMSYMLSFLLTAPVAFLLYRFTNNVYVVCIVAFVINLLLALT